jgi:predicted ATPase
VSEAHARLSDPISSELTVASLGKDTSYKALVVAAARYIETARDVTGHLRPWNDTQLWITIEAMTRRRHQRNVISRTRGLLERDGWFENVGLYDFDGRPLVHFILTPQAKEAS